MVFLNALVQVSCPSVPGLPAQCTDRSSICNRYPDCPGGMDEDSALCANFTCLEGTIKCSNGNKCVYGAFCNGYVDCLGPDYYSTSSVGQSDDGQIGGAPQQQVLDEDPAVCREYTCPVGSVKCRDGVQCVQVSVQCNGYKDCRGVCECRTWHTTA